MVVLDTNIIIDHLRQQKGNKTALIKANDKFGTQALHISAITLQELYEGKSTLKADKLTAMLLTLAPLKVLEYGLEVAEMSGKLARDLGKPIEFADAAIAGTCIYNKFELFTLNTKHFSDISELRLAEI